VTEQIRPEGVVESDEPASTAPEGAPETAVDPAEPVVVGEVVDATDV
jgi:hypothetical protein